MNKGQLKLAATIAAASSNLARAAITSGYMIMHTQLTVRHICIL
jgi:hypothetical protein